MADLHSTTSALLAVLRGFAEEELSGTSDVLTDCYNLNIKTPDDCPLDLALAAWVAEGCPDSAGCEPRSGRRGAPPRAALLERYLRACDLLEELAELEDGDPALDDIIEGAALFMGAVCRRCGCTEAWGCPDGCGWAQVDLCTSCVGVPGV